MAKVTFKEIAKHAGVSPSAVSIARNNQRGISDGTRARVLAAARELGYVRKPLPTLAQVIPVRLVCYQKHSLVVEQTPFFDALFDGIQKSCRRMGAALQIYYVQEKDGNEEEIQRQLNLHPEQGAILLATEMNEADVRRWMDKVPKLVVLDSYFGTLKVDTVAIDNEEGAYEATRFLIDKGYETIGHLKSAVDINNFRERERGFVRCMGEAGLQSTADIALESTLHGAKRDMEAYLNAGGTLPRALFADNDIIALGAIRAMQEKGIDVPGQVEVVGFDNLPYSQLASPPFSSCCVFKHQMARIAVGRLAQLRETRTGAHQKIRVATELVARG